MLVKNQKPKLPVLIFLIILLTAMSIPIFAHHQEGQAYDLLEEVYTVYELADANKYEAAREQLNQIKTALNTGHLSLSEEKLAYVLDVTENTIRHLESSIENHELKMDKVLAFVLMMESAKNPNSEMVVKWENQLTDQITNGLQSESRELQTEFYQVMDFYSIIYPAIKIKQDTKVWSQLDEQFINLNQIQNEEDMLHALNVMLQTFETLETPVDKQKDDDASLAWLIFTVGGVIVFTLFYVGFRKYKGEKKEKKIKKVDDL
ncbi:sporulation protein YpjB [Salinibacillus kushneri]|uniref:Sporulation protein YpjB n=1 Tax=Salinibacillus kushneri TaxID=237682 RepID=A0A1I0I266_9BACI|nr:sporulation protein YpjB [Salinibacillus kushneri]SET90549.1 sporulation protein YpjB [Salinibacillus kushneri]